MPTQSVTPGCAGHLQDISDVLLKAKKVVVVTGAGISTNLGIPDFRSENGLYALIQAQYDAAAAEREKAEREELKKQTILPIIKPRSPSPDMAGTPERTITRTRSASTRPIEPSIIKTRSATVIEAQDSHIFTRSRSDLTTWSRRQTLDDPDTLLRRNSSSILDSSNRTTLLRTSSASSRASTPLNTTSTPKPAIHPRPLKRSRSLELLPSVPKDAEVPQRSSKRLKLLSQPSSTPSTSTSKQHSPNPDTSEPSSQSSIASTTRAVLPKLKGKDLFDSMVWNEPLTTSIFLTFIAELRKQIRTEVVGTSQTHKLIKALRDGGRLIRCYTQNVDGLESREGLTTDLSNGTGRRSRFFAGNLNRPRPDDGGGDHFGGVEVVQLHGSLDVLRCSLCHEQSPWLGAPPETSRGEGSDPEHSHSSGSSSSGDSSNNPRDSRDGDDDQTDREDVFRGGRAPGCGRCIRADEARQHRGRRSVAVGKLRPDVVLYGEEHPEATRIGELVTHDISLGPDVMLIMGTSLRVHGLKVMVREFARAAHAKGGKVVFVNNTKPPESTWGDVLDYWVEMDCDRWVEDLKERRGELWLPQGLPAEPNKSEESSIRRANGLGKPDSSTMPARTSLPGMPESTPTTKEPQRPQSMREDEMNGAYWAYQIQLNLEIIGGRPRTYAPNCNPFRRWGPDKWRRQSGKPTPKSSTTTAASSALKSISTNVPRPVKVGREKTLATKDDSGGGNSRAAGSQLQRELSASVGPVGRSSGSLLLPTPPASDEAEEPESSGGVIMTPRTKERIRGASSIERILSSPVGMGRES